MTLTAQQIDDQLGKLSASLNTILDELEEADQAAVDAREAYILAYAKAFLSAEGPMDVRKQLALERTHAARLNAETQDRIVRGMVRRLKAHYERIGVGRTKHADVRAEAGLARTGAWGS